MSTEAPTQALELLITDPQGQTTTLKLDPGTYSLGRADDCEIRFPMSAKTVSRHHARLVVGTDGAALEDLDSRAGTMVNGQVMRQRRLEAGDVIAIATFTLKVQLPGQQPADKTMMVLPAAATLGTVTDQKVEALAGELDKLRAASEKLAAEVGKRIVGQRAIVRLVWATILAKGHCLMVGVPGLAKTMMVTTFAEALGVRSNRIQFTPDLMPSDIIGSNVIQEGEDGKRHFEFIQGPVFTQLLLADEINRTPPKTQAALLEAMQERQVTVANRSLSLPSPFCVIASQNPIEQEGTYPLPEAQQDRFMLCLLLDYPGRDEEVDILLRTTHGALADVSAVLGYQEILEFQALVDRIGVSRPIAAYAADVVRATRPKSKDAFDFVRELVDWGAGPRAGQSLVRAAKAVAAMDGRPAISHDDIREVAAPVLRHRLSCNYRARAQSKTADDLIAEVLARVKGP